MGILKASIAGLALATLASCASVETDALDDGYQLGDGFAHYCETTDETVRAAGRVLAARAGLTLPNLCAAHALLNDEVPEYGDAEQ